MRSALDVPLDELLEAVEAAAAGGAIGAGRLLPLLLEEEGRTGALSVIARLCAARYLRTREFPDAAVKGQTAVFFAATDRGVRVSGRSFSTRPLGLNNGRIK